MPRVITSGLAAVMMASLLSAPPASAAPPFHSLADASGAVRSDGVRYAAWPTADGRTVVLDTHTGRRIERATPTCTAPSQFAPPQPLARLDAVGSGFLLWDCHGMTPFWQDTYPLIAPIAGGPPIVPPGAHSIIATLPADAPVIGFAAIGSQWLEAIVYGYHYTTDVDLNWRTGQIVRNAPAAPGQISDLDLRGLIRRLCAPIRRVGWGGADLESTPPFAPMQYEPPFALTRDHERRPLILQRCGTTRRTRLGPTIGRDEQLGAGIVTWAGIRTVWALNARTGARVAYHPISGRSQINDVVHTRSLILVAAQSLTGTGAAVGPTRILAARLSHLHR